MTEVKKPRLVKEIEKDLLREEKHLKRCEEEGLWSNDSLKWFYISELFESEKFWSEMEEV